MEDAPGYSLAWSLKCRRRKEWKHRIGQPDVMSPAIPHPLGNDVYSWGFWEPAMTGARGDDGMGGPTGSLFFDLQQVHVAPTSHHPDHTHQPTMDTPRSWAVPMLVVGMLVSGSANSLLSVCHAPAS